MERRHGRLRAVVARMREDLEVVLEKDPAPRSRVEVLLYPHIHALWTYRVAHWLYERERLLLARALSMYGRWLSGIEIHPGASIGRRFFIDHGSGVVIGETVVIGDDVMLYHQVTLGSVGWWRDRALPPGARRHPVVEDDVVVGAGASVLGAITVGARSRIGAHAVVLHDLPPDSRVSAPAATPLRPAAGAGDDGRRARPDHDAATPGAVEHDGARRVPDAATPDPGAADGAGGAQATDGVAGPPTAVPYKRPGRTRTR